MIAARLAGLLGRPTDTGGRRARPLLGIRVLRAVLWLVVVSGPVAAGVLTLQVSALRHRVEEVGQQAVVVTQDVAHFEGSGFDALADRTEEVLLPGEYRVDDALDPALQTGVYAVVGP